ncbi:MULTISPECIES: YqhA family protein [unclassified Gordonia (in: high G+C Gram-positive bacteria)]|uniref:YqhA family protein n=1 Tax=Gordonia TaxID=2053 RepID=UPI000990DA16|nr:MULTISPECIES: YqhA family protein [unclassified Gordonia (in: high G+C Gram-positive bacteria)]MCX2756721.1 YqhA family protein [Gordonia sp. 4N]MDT0224023.1 YqhA family protein [Gordonia sp. AC31]
MDHSPHEQTSRARPKLEAVRFVSVVGSLTALMLAALTYLWAAAKAVTVVAAVAEDGVSSDRALVKLFESIDSILLATVLLMVGFGLWELLVADLHLPPALTTTSFDQLKGRVAGTLLLVLVVRFFERLIARPNADDLLALGISTALVGALLLVFASSHRDH